MVFLKSASLGDAFVQAPFHHFHVHRSERLVLKTLKFHGIQIRAQKDQLITRKQDVIYSLFDWPQKTNIICIGKVIILLTL